MSTLEEHLVDWRNSIVDYILQTSKFKDSEFSGQLFSWIFLGSWCFILAATASYFTITYGPGANGSGIAECIAYLNGVNYPKLIGWPTFIVKSICVVVGIAAQLCIGKEGPLAHIGANVAILLIYMVPLETF